MKVSYTHSNSNSISVATVPFPKEELAIRLPSSPRSASILALTVFVTTTTQVLVQPLVVLIDGQVKWTLAFAPPLMLSILIVGCAAQAAAFLLSSRWPEITVLVATAVYIGLTVVLAVPTWLIGMYLVIALALFLLAARRPGITGSMWLLGSVVIVGTALFVWSVAIGLTWGVATSFVIPETIRIAAPAGAAVALGGWWRAQALRVSRARIQSENAKKENDERVEHAARAERVRIAQELHDVAGQHLAGLITLAEAALTIAPARPEDALSLVEEVRDEGRFAAASLAGALADLRAVDTDSRETTKDLRQTDDLCCYWKKHGMNIYLTTTGSVEDLPAAVSTMAYRCVQEAITNAAKHAPGSRVDVSIASQHGQLDVGVMNGPSASRGTADARLGPTFGIGLGWGLAGIRERIDLLRGTLVFGAIPGGGWTVRFVIPVAQGRG